MAFLETQEVVGVWYPSPMIVHVIDDPQWPHPIPQSGYGKWGVGSETAYLHVAISYMRAPIKKLHTHTSLACQTCETLAILMFAWGTVSQNDLPLIAERLSARQLIVQRSHIASVYIYICIYIYIYVYIYIYMYIYISVTL